MNPKLEKLFGDPNKKTLKKLQHDVDAINAFESRIQPLSDAELRAKTNEFRTRLKAGETITDLTHEAFAVVREAARRTLGQRHYDVQLIGGMVLHSGAIAEMRTGEGKTLSATTAAYVNALLGEGVHVVTVNDYLARRDADWMGQVYHFLGLTVGCIQNQLAYIYDADIDATRRDDAATNSDTNSTDGDGYEALVVADMEHLREVTRQDAYTADIIFGTNNEFGFDYLRDNMVQRPEDRVQRGLNFAIVDEIDSILIDEARTPLIISAPDNRSTGQYRQVAQLVSQLAKDSDFSVDEKQRAVSLTEAGIAKLEQALGVDNLYVESGIRMVHQIEQALKARMLFARDKDYIVKAGEVYIVDEFTGRVLQGRRYSEGLHQAIEAKEGLEVKQESRTLATITLQNYFRLYDKLSGMTGTAATEREEFFKMYGLDVVVIPTHRDIVRVDGSDRVYKNAQGKYQAVVQTVKELHQKGQPVLLGTISIEHNELISQLLGQAGIPHNVLNAKQHELEAETIAQAGKKGAVTVATNMAGRGVDIILGGNPVDINQQREVIALGGLAVIGTERHESRRIDNQLRGRAGRQGDPGLSQFFVSMDDDLLRIFGSDRMKNLMTRLGVPDDMPIENNMVSRSIESAQKKVESKNFDIRKHLVEYDDVMNKHRDAVYRRRDAILHSTPAQLKDMLLADVDREIEHIVSLHTNTDTDTDWDTTAICTDIAAMMPITADSCVAQVNSSIEGRDGKKSDAEARTQVIELFSTLARTSYDQAVKHIGDPGTVHSVHRSFALRVIDTLWVQHLDQMAFLRDSIGLQGYGQRDPLVEYKRESYGVFQKLLASIDRDIVQNLFKLRAAQHIHESNEVADAEYSAPAKEMQEHPGSTNGGSEAAPKKPHKADNRDDTGHKIGRNEPCSCGSGKKYKKCHGQ